MTPASEFLKVLGSAWPEAALERKGWRLTDGGCLTVGATGRLGETAPIWDFLSPPGSLGAIVSPLGNAFACPPPCVLKVQGSCRVGLGYGLGLNLVPRSVLESAREMSRFKPT